uniref:Uncharacterized protein n=1 Tax=Heterorhabditis bacteriophora TaxID=37862 RepID=A0A1I7WHJ0_HETBA
MQVTLEINLHDHTGTSHKITFLRISNEVF